MQRLRLLLLPLLALLACGAVTESATAKSSIRVGVGDQSANMFGQPAYEALGLKTTRYFFPWNGMDNPAQKAAATDFVDRARASGVSVLFHLSTDNFALKQAKLPTVKAYTTQLKAIVPYFRSHGVKEWGTWNEANHASQPTYKNPKRAAEFFKAMYGVVGKKGSIVGLDVLDQVGVQNYEKKFYAALTPTFQKRVKYVGIHNYGDVNRKRTAFTPKIIAVSRKYNRSTKFWFTETGGLVQFPPSFPCSVDRAATKTKNVFSLAKKYKSQGVQRVYLYNWFGTSTGNTCAPGLFDAGLVGSDGAVRPAYGVFKSILPNYSK